MLGQLAGRSSTLAGWELQFNPGGMVADRRTAVERMYIIHPILHGGRLFQQFTVDMYIKIEGCRLNWIMDHQPEIRADLYKGIVDSITAGETRASAVGTRIVLPWKF
jgi:hypothetical protein